MPVHVARVVIAVPPLTQPVLGAIVCPAVAGIAAPGSLVHRVALRFPFGVPLAVARSRTVHVSSAVRSATGQLALGLAFPLPAVKIVFVDESPGYP